jgi:A/G-specific adenine glycosylase
MQSEVFSKSAIDAVERWFLANGRKLFIRDGRNPYRVWISEIALQQTQVSVAENYLVRFFDRFPHIESLASAPIDDVLALWSGLGYYGRARNLHKAALQIMVEHGGQLPEDYQSLLKLPGIGSYTAGAIASFAFKKAAPVVDGNVQRVLARYFADGTPLGSALGKKHFEALSLALAKKSERPWLIQEGIMELGATLCRKHQPRCLDCPLQTGCEARRTETQPAYPSVRKRALKSKMELAVLLASDGESIWLKKDPSNGNQGLYGGLFTPPNLAIEPGEQPNATLKRLAMAYGIATDDFSSDKPIKITRVLTHRLLTLHAFRCSHVPEHISGEERIALSDLEQFGISAATKALLKSAGLI